MNTHYTDQGSENPNPNPSGHGSSIRFHARRNPASLLHTPALHLRALLRLARRRHTLALGIAVATGSVLGIATAVVSTAAMQTVIRAAEPTQDMLAGLVHAPDAPTPPHFKRPLPTFVSSLVATNPLRGIASWYGAVLHGHTTASGEIFDEALMTACHRTLPFGTLVRVTDLDSNRSVVVRINDRGVLNADRVIDLSSAAAGELGILRAGLARVKLEVLGKT